MISVQVGPHRPRGKGKVLNAPRLVRWDEPRRPDKCTVLEARIIGPAARVLRGTGEGRGVGVLPPEEHALMGSALSTHLSAADACPAVVEDGGLDRRVLALVHICRSPVVPLRAE